MKTMMKKCGIYAAFAVVLLATAALVTGCSTGSSGADEEQLPEGMGGVKINFNDTVEQRATILPGNLVLSNFLGGFKLTFTAVTNGKNETKYITVANANGPYPTIPLVPGTYNLMVDAFLDVPDGKVGAIYQATSPLNVTSGTSVSITISLQAVSTGSGTGIFDYTINSSISNDMLESADMKITNIASATLISTIPLTSDFKQSTPTPVNGYEELPVGYYYVDFELEITGSKTNNFRHILHIYQNMTSPFTYTFTNTHFNFIAGKISMTYTHPSDIVPTITVTTASTASNAISGNGSLNNPWKVSKSDTNVPDKLTVTVTNVGLFLPAPATFTGTLGGDATTAVTAVGGTMTLDFSSVGSLSSIPSRDYPYQFIVTGTTGTPAEKPYESAEYFIIVSN